VANALNVTQIQDILAPFHEIKPETEDGWEKRIWDRMQDKIVRWDEQLMDKGVEPDKLVKWELASMHSLFNEARWDAFNAIPETHAREPFLAFHGSQLAFFGSIIENGFKVDNPSGWYGNGAYFTTCLPYSQHYIGGFRGMDKTTKFLLPTKGNTVYILGAMLKPGKTIEVPVDTTKPGAPYAGIYRDQPKADGYDSHIAWVTPEVPSNPNAVGFRPTAKDKAWADEIVMFDQSRILPRYIIGLKRIN